MAKSKHKKSKDKKVPRKIKALKQPVPKEKLIKEKLDPRIEKIYEREITFDCPVRGLVTQKVKVKRYKPLAEQHQKQPISSASEVVDKLEEKDSGLSIYNDGEELGIVDTSAGDTE